MNLNRIIVISLFVLMLSSYETSSSFLFGFLMKLLMIKGALFMSMPLSIGAFVMGQGMGFFAGNMMGGYMMLRAANRYHNKEKSRWVSYSGWHGPPFNTNTYQKGYQKGKAIVDAINAGKQKVNAIASIFKPFIPSTTRRPIKGWSSSPPKYGPPPPPPPSYGPPKGWSTGIDYSYGSYSDPDPTVHAPPPLPTYGAPPPPPPPPPSLAYGHPPIGGPLDYQDYYPGGNRKTGFSSVLTNTLSGGNRLDMDDQPEKIRRVFTDAPSPSGFYTSAYRTPGQEFTGILTNDPTSQGDRYLRGEPNEVTESSREASSTMSSFSTATSQPNDILEGYLEQRLKAEAEKQKDMERKQEAQQLLQMLRKAYLKQLVDSLKEEELAQKTKSNRRLESSPFASLTSSIESLFGSRETRSMERKNDNEVDNNRSSPSGLSSSTQNLIRDLLINEVFTSSTTSPRSVEVSESDKPDEEPTLDTQEVASITERIMGLTSTEREELVKGIDELGQDQEEEDQMSALGSSIVEQVIAKPMLTLTNVDYADSLLKMIHSTENTIASNERGEQQEETKHKREDRGPQFPVIPPAMWVPVDDPYSAEMNINTPFVVRVRRQTGSGDGTGSLLQAQQAASGGSSSAESNPEAQKQVQAFVDDIRKFFTLLSALDQDQCLQKLVCDVHTNEKDVSSLTQYEQNILTTFKLMKALMPEGEEDSSTKYRYAALVGETSQSMELCQQTFATCTVESSQIVELGSQPQDASGLPVDLSKMQNMPGPGTDSTPPQTTMRPKETPVAVAPAPVSDQDSKETETQRRNDYEPQNQYYETPQRRRRPQAQPQHHHHQHSPQQYHREQIQHNRDRDQYAPNSNRRQQHQQQPHYKIRNRYPPQRDRHDIEEQPNPRDQPPRESRPPPPQRPRPPPQSSQDSNIWDYGDFQDFFRSMWSDTMMRGRMGRSQYHRNPWRSRSSINQNRRQRWGHPVERIEEIGI